MVGRREKINLAQNDNAIIMASSTQDFLSRKKLRLNIENSN